MRRASSVSLCSVISDTKITRPTISPSAPWYGILSVRTHPVLSPGTEYFSTTPSFGMPDLMISLFSAFSRAPSSGEVKSRRRLPTRSSIGRPRSEETAEFAAGSGPPDRCARSLPLSNRRGPDRNRRVSSGSWPHPGRPFFVPNEWPTHSPTSSRKNPMLKQASPVPLEN